MYSICFAWEEGAVCKDLCDKFYPISTTDKDAILKACLEEKIDGITTIASDVATLAVNYVAEKMGLVGNRLDIATSWHQLVQRLSLFVYFGNDDEKIPPPTG